MPKAVEPCQSFHVRRDRASKHLVLEPASRKCPRFYHYPRHPTLGFMHAGSGLAAVQRACPRQRTPRAGAADRSGADGLPPPRQVLSLDPRRDGERHGHDAVKGVDPAPVQAQPPCEPERKTGAWPQPARSPTPPCWRTSAGASSFPTACATATCANCCSPRRRRTKKKPNGEARPSRA